MSKIDIMSDGTAAFVSADEEKIFLETVKAQSAAVHRLKNEQQRHDLCNRRAGSLLMCIFLKKNFACARFH